MLIFFLLISDFLVLWFACPSSVQGATVVPYILYFDIKGLLMTIMLNGLYKSISEYYSAPTVEVAYSADQGGRGREGRHHPATARQRG